MHPLSPARIKLLIVDDQKPNLDLLRQILKQQGYEILVAPDGRFCLQIAQRAHPDLILLDIIMPEIDGFEVCRRLKADKATKEIPVIFITAKDQAESVVEGFQVGAIDYITKPFAEEEVLARVETHVKINGLTKVLQEKNAALTEANDRLAQSNERLQQEITRREQTEDALEKVDEKFSVISQQEAKRWGLAGFVAESQMMSEIMTDIRRLHQHDTTVLIQGESGTGKELIARAIHFGGARSPGTFLPLNCSAIPHELAESTLFGHVRGAFTGADNDRQGYFELTDGGTLFLDEVGDMPLGLQPKLLRVLEDGSFIPVGGKREKHVNVRVIAATNADLQVKIAAGAFREDLYYRLARFTVPVPPLRERPEDIPSLTTHFLKLFATEMGLESPPFSKEALNALMSYPFPGNVRELKNIIERALIESAGQTIRPEHLYFARRPADAETNQLPLRGAIEAQYDLKQLPLNLQQAESILIERVLEKTDGNIAKSARLLGIGRKTLYRKINENNITFDSASEA